MTDRWAVVLALSAATGAVLARPVGLALAGGLVVVAVATRRPVLLCAGVLLLASGLATLSYQGLRAPIERAPLRAHATLVSDPEWIEGGALRVQLRLPGGRRVEAFARGPTTSLLRDRLAGERVEVDGRLSPVPARARRYLDSRHVSARLALHSVGSRVDAGSVPSRVANSVRRTLVRGAESFEPAAKGLFLGFVLGDDREQPPEVVDDFRASGLSHLLAVSGQNVAFMLALAAPFLRRFELRGRLLAGLTVLALFGVMTRWEPSVLRAVAMAGLAMFSATIGRPQSSMRMLALAVTGLLLVDPLLVRSVGFLLSVGACVGIAVFSARVEDALPGPRLVREPLALTLAAQAGVAPVALSVFGGLPVASLPANLLAAPAAALVMSWGIAAGLPAGLLGGATAEALHLPTRVLVAWTGGVARMCARLPLGWVRWHHLLLLVALVVVARLVRRPAVASVAAVLVLPALQLAIARPPPLGGDRAADGVRLWRSGGATVVVVDRLRPEQVLTALRDRQVARVDVLVSRQGSRSAGRALGAVRSRLPVRAVLGPVGHQLAGAHEAVVGSTIRAGPLAVRVITARPLEVEVATCTVAGCAWRSGTGTSTSPLAPS